MGAHLEAMEAHLWDKETSLSCEAHSRPKKAYHRAIGTTLRATWHILGSGRPPLFFYGQPRQESELPYSHRCNSVPVYQCTYLFFCASYTPLTIGIWKRGNAKKGTKIQHPNKKALCLACNYRGLSQSQEIPVHCNLSPLSLFLVQATPLWMVASERGVILDTVHQILAS